MNGTEALTCVAAALVGFVGCDDKKEALLAATGGEAGASATTAPSAAPPPTSTPSVVASAAADGGAEAKRFDPKHKCPTGQTHFYMEGDFCRRKCFTNADCGKKEHCSSMDYATIVDGGPAGMAKFCEGM